MFTRRLQFAAFAAACATRLAPIFESFARADQGRFQGWLAQLWTCIASPEASQSQGLLHQVLAAPEASVDDSHRPDYRAMRVLGVLYDALQVLLVEDVAEAALRCSREAVSVLRDLDYILKIPQGSPGSLAEMELRAEQEWIDGLDAAQQGFAGRCGIDEARASDLYKRLQEVPEEIALVYDWDLSEWSH